MSSSADTVSSSTASVRANRATPSAPLWLLALFTFSGTLAMHIFVPALAMAARDLNASSAAMQMTVSLYVLGLACGQLIYGPLSDRYGRRPVLMAGLVVYTLAGLVCALATQANVLIVARLFQALGGCSGLVLGRAIVRDTAGTDSAAKRLAMMNLMVILAPALAPLIGSMVAAVAGWRILLVLLCLLGVANFWLAWRKLTETHPGTSSTNVRTLVHEYRGLLGSRQFLGYTVGGGCATTSMYAFIASAPFIFVEQMHRPEHEVGVYLTIMVLGAWLGNLLCGRLLGRLPIGRLLVAGNTISLICVVVALAWALLGQITVPGLLTLMFLFTVGAGVSSPAAITLALSVSPKVVGSASGVYGFVQMAVGALCTALAGLGSSPLMSAMLVMLSACVVAQLALRMAMGVRKVI
jgi:DHA1 family bicyclomycin/chloramphenicol resistance-like MFS transporter